MIANREFGDGAGRRPQGMPSVEPSREEFEKRYRSRFADPAFEPLSRELDAITAAAWDAYSNSRKAPLTRKAGQALPIRTTIFPWTGSRRARPFWPRSVVTTTPARRRGFC
jgi:hypothetical protein